MLLYQIELKIAMPDYDGNRYKPVKQDAVDCEENLKKSDLRKIMIKLRASQSQGEIAEKSAQIVAQLLAWPPFQNAKSVMIYMDYNSEVQTADIIDHCFKNQQTVIVPVVTSKKGEMALVEIRPDTVFAKSSLGILEPVINQQMLRNLNDVDLILAPGVAFDLKGNRLGYGGGYYDRLLGKNPELRQKIKVYALAFECQISDAIATEPTDCKIDGLITEKQIYQF